MGHSILLVDDDAELGSLMAEFFGQHEFALTSEHDSRRGLAKALDGGFDLVILDVMMPGLDGFEILHQLRRRNQVPVIMLTARTAQQDRIAGLEAGADDYLPKPFGPEELLARIRAVLRRTRQIPSTQADLEVNGIRLNPAKREVWRGDQRVDVTSAEFDVLDVLMRSAGRVVSRDQLAATLYQREATPFERSVDVHVSHLRKKLEQADGELIRTVRGVGYLFCAG
jgi:two-component system, OmpR family, response regulator CpxR